jgi:hypothetical protein
MDSFRDESMCHMQDIHRVDIFQDYALQSIAIHFLIWDPGGGVHYCSVMSPLWDIITGQRLMMTRVARWML